MTVWTTNSCNQRWLRTKNLLYCGAYSHSTYSTGHCIQPSINRPLTKASNLYLCTVHCTHYNMPVYSQWLHGRYFAWPHFSSNTSFHSSLFRLSIHLPQYLPYWVAGNLESILGDSGHIAEYTLNRMAVYHRAQSYTRYGQLRDANQPTCLGTGKGNRKTWRKPPWHRKIKRTPHTHMKEPQPWRCEAIRFRCVS